MKEDTEVNAEKPTGRFFSMFEEAGYYENDAVYLNAGAPGTEMLRMLPTLIEAATSHRMQLELDGDAQLFQYGVENGNWQFRSFLSTFLSEEYGEPVNCDRLFMTAGASSGLWLILTCFFSPGMLVFVEDPTYFCALQVFADYKMNVVAVHTDDDGIVVEDLEQKLKEHLSDNEIKCHPPLRGLVYLVPVYHNPTGSVLPQDRCKRLVNLARKYSLTILCDDVYNLLHYDDSSICPKRLFSYDNESNEDYVGNIISNGSFSKILGPGLRIGWLEAPEWAVVKLKRFGLLQSGGGLNTFTAGIITSLLALGKMNTHLQKVRNMYKMHMEATADLLRKELPSGCYLKSPAKGGYFLWIQLPDSIDSNKLLLFTKKEYKVTFLSGNRTSISGNFSNCVRICISFYPIDVLLSAVRKFCLAIMDFQSKAEKNPDFWQAYQ